MILKKYLLKTSLLFMCVSSSVMAMQEFPLSSVRITDGPFFQAQLTNKKYLLELDTEKLLAPFRREAGLPFKESYGNWENTGLDGHIGGHYISALAYMYASTGDKEIKARLDYVIEELEKVQKAFGNGYIGGVPKSREFVKELESGKINAELFSLNGRWVPWYNLHKTFAGLRDAYQVAGIEKAKPMLIAYADWAYRLNQLLGKEKMQQMLHSEHGSMNEIFADVYAITKNKKYLELADDFSQRTILEPLLHSQDKLTGFHANTQIPKVVGYQKVGDANNNQAWLDASAFFWDTVVNRRSVSIGGNSVREHFHSSDDFTPMMEDPEGPETCNTYNMLKLSRLLHNKSHDPKYLEYYERGLFNHILSSQHPVTGGLVYFTSMRPNHYRTYSQVHDGMWCCVGSGIESQSKYGEYIYTYDYSENKTPELFVNLFVSADLNWEEEKIVLSQQTQFPDESTTTIVVNSDKKFVLNLRHPEWAKNGTVEIYLNGKRVHRLKKSKNSSGSYLPIERDWKAGDTIEYKFSMTTALEQLPDGKDFYSVLYGPIVLAAKTNPFRDEKLSYFADDSRMGHIANGQLCSIEQAPFILGNSDKFLKKLKRAKNNELVFNAKGVIDDNQSGSLELIPFFRLHESRYTVYFPYAKGDEVQKLRKQKAEQEAAQLALIAQTIDSIQPGQQQPESDHFYQGEGSEMGINGERHWRHATKWFSYQLNNREKNAREILLTFASVDAGREFSVLLDDELITEIKLEPNAQAFYDVSFKVPERFKSKEAFRIKFVAKENSIAGGLYGVRLLK